MIKELVHITRRSGLRHGLLLFCWRRSHTCFWTYTMLMYMTICTLILWFLRVKRILDWNARTKMWRGPVIFGSIPLSKPTDIYNFTEQQSSLVS